MTFSLQQFYPSDLLLCEDSYLWTQLETQIETTTFTSSSYDLFPVTGLPNKVKAELGLNTLENLEPELQSQIKNLTNQILEKRRYYEIWPLRKWYHKNWDLKKQDFYNIAKLYSVRKTRLIMLGWKKWNTMSISITELLYK